MSEPITRIGCVANVYTRQMHFTNTGDTEPGHAHPFDHMTLLAHGSLRVTVNGSSTDYEAPEMIWIARDLIHELEALEPGTVAYCIHALRKGEGIDDIVDPDSVPDGAMEYFMRADPVAQGELRVKDLTQ